MPGGEGVLGKQAVASKPGASSSSHTVHCQGQWPHTLLILKNNSIHSTNSFVYLCS